LLLLVAVAVGIQAVVVVLVDLGLVLHSRLLAALHTQ
jgi:hypothetical protein